MAFDRSTNLIKIFVSLDQEVAWEALINHMEENGMVRTTPSTFFGMSNRVEHQKLNQVAAELSPG